MYFFPKTNVPIIKNEIKVKDNLPTWDLLVQSQQ